MKGKIDMVCKECKWVVGILLSKYFIPVAEVVYFLHDMRTCSEFSALCKQLDSLGLLFTELSITCHCECAWALLRPCMLIA